MKIAAYLKMKEQKDMEADHPIEGFGTELTQGIGDIQELGRTELGGPAHAFGVRVRAGGGESGVRENLDRFAPAAAVIYYHQLFQENLGRFR